VTQEARKRARVSGVALVTFEVLGAALLLASARKLAHAVYAPLGPYDDGVLLTDSMLVSMGHVPYRDFYTNYGPGIFLTIAALWKVTGVSALAARGLGCLLHVAVAALSGLLAGRATDRRFSTLAAGLVAAWLSCLPPSPLAWLAALAAALLMAWILSLALEAPSRPRWFAAGAALATVSWYRPDLAVYLVLALAVVGAGARLVGAALPSGPGGGKTAAAAVTVGALAAALPAWGPILWLSGAQPVRDVLLEQLRIRPARVLPLPPLLAPVWTPEASSHLPAALVDVHSGAVVLALAGPVLALAAVAAATRLGRVSRPSATLLAALALAVLPQLLGRSDREHAVQAVAPAVAVFAAAAHAIARTRPAAGLVASVLVAGVFFPARDLRPLVSRGSDGSTRDFPQYGGLPEKDPAVLAVARLLRDATAPEEPVFVGLADHRRTVLNHLLVYFAAFRRGGTRYLQFDPNLTTREDVQAEIVRDLESRRVRWVVLWNEGEDRLEPNESSRPGSDLLDRYLRSRFTPRTRLGAFEVRSRAEP
jgi:hypothetical protein